MKSYVYYCQSLQPRTYKKVQPTHYTQEQDGYIRVSKKKNVRLRIVLGKKNGYNLGKINMYQNEGTRNKCRRREKAHDLKHTHHLSKMVEEVS